RPDLGVLIDMPVCPAPCDRQAREEVTELIVLRSDGGERGNLKPLSRDDADTVDDLPTAFQHFDLRGVWLPGGPRIDRAGCQCGLGVGWQQERQLDGIDRNIGLTQ